MLIVPDRWLLAFLLVGCAAASACSDPELIAPTTEDDVTHALARIETSMGVIELELYPEVAPLAVRNFRTLAAQSYFAGVIFHRVLPGFIIQSGDSTGTGFGGRSIWGTPFRDEFDSTVVFDRPGRLAMANSGPGTNRSQFFITTRATPHLDLHHTIFGQVRSGMDVVIAISEVATNPTDNRPLQPVVIQSVVIRDPWPPPM